MKKQQLFAPVVDGSVYRIRCTRRPFHKGLVLEINGESFSLPWGAREEIFRLGDEQAVLCVAATGRVSIRMRDGEIPECDASTFA